MSNRRFVPTSFGTVEVREISEHHGVVHYGVRLCPRGPEEQLHLKPSGELITAYSDMEFLGVSGLPLSVARECVQQTITAQFDAQVREIVRLEILDHASPAMVKRALELGLATA